MSAFFILSACTAQQDKDRISQLEKQLQNVQEKINEQRRAASLDSQQKCSEGAHKAYVIDGFDKAKTDTFNSYTNHFNEKLSRCLIEVTSMTVTPSTGRIFTSRMVSDAFEGKVLGEIYIDQNKGDPPGALPVFKCELTSLTGEKKSCHKVDEYENFILQFMN